MSSAHSTSPPPSHCRDVQAVTLSETLVDTDWVTQDDLHLVPGTVPGASDKTVRDPQVHDRFVGDGRCWPELLRRAVCQMAARSAAGVELAGLGVAHSSSHRPLAVRAERETGPLATVDEGATADLISSNPVTGAGVGFVRELAGLTRTRSGSAPRGYLTTTSTPLPTAIFHGKALAPIRSTDQTRLSHN
jgi:hypothetical protein